MNFDQNLIFKINNYFNERTNGNRGLISSLPCSDISFQFDNHSSANSLTFLLIALAAMMIPFSPRNSLFFSGA